MKKLTLKEVESILLRYSLASPERKRHMVRELADGFGVSPKAIRDILKGIHYAHVLPEIPRIFVSGHGCAWISDRAIQQIRATWDAYPERQGKGLQAALHRKTGVSEQHLSKIVNRSQRVSVLDDPEAVFDLGELEFESSILKGEKHGNSKLSNADVLEFHRLFHEEGLPYKEIADRFGITSSNVGQIIRGVSRSDSYEEYHGYPPEKKKSA